MPVVDSVIKNVIGDVIAPVIGPVIGVAGAVRRNFTIFETAASAYVFLTSHAMAAGNFTLTVKTTFDNNSTQDFISSSTDYRNGTVSYRPGSTLMRVYCGGVSTPQYVDFGPVASLNDGNLHEIVVTRSVGVPTLMVDGVSVAKTGGSALFDGGFSFDRAFRNLTYTPELLEFSAGEALLVNMSFDEDHVSDNIAINKANAANNGTYINITSADAELFTLKNGVWSNADESVAMEIAY